LFLLVYLRTYPLQVIMGELFGLTQPAVNSWIHRLLPVLRAALDDLGVLPERDPQGRASARFSQVVKAQGVAIWWTFGDQLQILCS
jgi:DDE superfamily endonuclease